jgi:TrmH family RNA methyltransferase
MKSALAITSTHNPRFRRAVKLRDRRQREKHGRFLIEGMREIRLALEGGISLEELFACPALCESDPCQRVIDYAADHGAQLFSVSRRLIDKLCFGDRAEGLLAVAVTPSRTLDDLRLPDRPLVAVLEGIEKPGNVGAILRSADGAGLDAVIVADPATDLFNPHAIRASLGTIFTVPASVASSAQVAAWLRGQGLHVFAARVEGAVPYTQADFTPAAAIVLGSEAGGLSSAWIGSDVTAVSLPMCGAADSLNVSAAAAVMFYEALRQRSLGHAEKAASERSASAP